MSSPTPTEEEMLVMFRALSLIARRDRDALEHIERFVPFSASYFWDCIDGYGRQNFSDPDPGDIDQYDVFQKGDGSGIFVDAFLRVIDAGPNEFKGITITFEVDRTVSPSVIYGGPAVW